MICLIAYLQGLNLESERKEGEADTGQDEAETAPSNPLPPPPSPPSVGA